VLLLLVDMVLLPRLAGTVLLPQVADTVLLAGTVLGKATALAHPLHTVPQADSLRRRPGDHLPVLTLSAYLLIMWLVVGYGV
jgi:hypothetical protein